MFTSQVIDVLFIVALVALIVMIGFMISLIIKTRHLVGNWSKVSDTLSDSMVRLIPAVLNIGTIGKGIHEVMESIAHHKKTNEKK